jgi:hypothetical protein
MSTDFEHFEIISGALSYVLKYIKPSFYTDLEQGFAAMNDALKQRAGNPRK